jgi:hypothetical protein
VSSLIERSVLSVYISGLGCIINLYSRHSKDKGNMIGIQVFDLYNKQSCLY